MTKLLVVTAALLGMSTAAGASDLPAMEMAPSAYAPVASAFDWTGFYAGVHAGASFHDQRVERGVIEGSVFPEFDHPVDLSEVFDLLFPPELGSADGVGFMGGVQAGYNQQFGSFVLGIEADISRLGNEAAEYSATYEHDHFHVDSGDATLMTDLTIGHSMDWLGTTRLRAGLAVENLMVFGTAGLAFGNPTNSVNFDAEIDVVGNGGVINQPLVDAHSFSGSSSGMKMGWAAGAGAEYAITESVSIKAEYVYYDLGDTTVAATSSDAPDFSAEYTFKNVGQAARIGLNYRF